MPYCQSHQRREKLGIGTYKRTIGNLYLLHHRLSLSPHFVPLMPHLVRLASDVRQSSTKQPYLQHTRCCQKEREHPYSPIGPISLGTGYRHRGQFADTYGMLCIFGSLLVSCCTMAWGLSQRRRRSRWFLYGVSLTLDAAACASGAIGCLLWGWWTPSVGLVDLSA